MLTCNAISKDPKTSEPIVSRVSFLIRDIRRLHDISKWGVYSAEEPITRAYFELLGLPLHLDLIIKFESLNQIWTQEL